MIGIFGDRVKEDVIDIAPAEAAGDWTLTMLYRASGKHSSFLER